MEQENAATSPANQSSGRIAGIVIALATVVMILFMAHHPLPSPGDTNHFIREMVKQGTASAVVHGVLIGAISLLMLGFTGLGDQLGWNYLSVRAGAMAYAIGCAGMTTAALIDGFVLPELAARYASSQGNDLETFHTVMLLLSLAISAVARLGVFGLALAVMLWSLALVWRAEGKSAVGALGLVAGVVPFVLLLTGRLSIQFHDMMAFIVSQATWYLAVAVQLIRNRL